MKILLVGNYRQDAQHSMLRFCDALAAALRRAGQDARVVHPDLQLARHAQRSTKRGKWLAYIDKFLLFIPKLRSVSRWAEVVHVCDHAYSVYSVVLKAVPVIVTCHDLLAVRCAMREFPGQKVQWTGRQYQRLIVRGLEHAAFVACDSIATRLDLLRLSGVPEHRTAVVDVGFNFEYKPISDRERIGRLSGLGIGAGNRYMIHVGSDLWYKNLSGVVRIFSLIAAFPEYRDLRLVMVGSKPTHELSSIISDCQVGDRITMLSNLPSEDLRALYSGSCGLLFPSLCEGFGWPVIEAQACGCPVFASNRSPMTEVGGRGAVYFDPEDYNEAARTIRRNLSHSEEMRSAGFLNAQRFSAESTAASYEEIYSKAIAQQ